MLRRPDCAHRCQTRWTGNRRQGRRPSFTCISGGISEPHQVQAATLGVSCQSHWVVCWGLGRSDMGLISQSLRKVRGLTPGVIAWRCSLTLSVTSREPRWQVSVMQENKHYLQTWKRLPVRWKMTELCFIYKQALVWVNLCTVTPHDLSPKARERNGSCWVTATSGRGDVHKELSDRVTGDDQSKTPL